LEDICFLDQFLADNCSLANKVIQTNLSVNLDSYENG